MSKWTSRKWMLTLANEVVGGLTAVLGAFYGEEKVIYGGLTYMLITGLGYLKAEKDVDAAREGATTIHECACDCPSCQG